MSSQGCDHGVHFFKIILESNIRDGELRVPRSFVMRHWQGISNPVSLRLPNSTEWKVYWMKRDGDVWFHNGWKEFAQYLSLDVSQFVVFRYEENSYFNVIIFDKSALEIKYPSRVTDEKGEEVDESDYSLKILEDCSPFKVKRDKSPSPSSRTRKKMKTNPRQEQADAGFDNAKQMGGKQTQGLNFDKSKFASAKKELDEDLDGTTECLKVEQLTSKITEEEPRSSFQGRSPNTNGALKEAYKIASENPFFTVIIRPQNQYTPLVPVAFVRKYFIHNTQIVKLQFGKKLWPVKFLCYPHNSAAKLSRGWFQFARECKLVVGDICVFELINKEDAVFDVHIFRGHS